MSTPLSIQSEIPVFFIGSETTRTSKKDLFLSQAHTHARNYRGSSTSYTFNMIDIQDEEQLGTISQVLSRLTRFSEPDSITPYVLVYCYGTDEGKLNIFQSLFTAVQDEISTISSSSSSSSASSSSAIYSPSSQSPQPEIATTTTTYNFVQAIYLVSFMDDPLIGELASYINADKYACCNVSDASDRRNTLYDMFATIEGKLFEYETIIESNVEGYRSFALDLRRELAPYDHTVYFIDGIQTHVTLKDYYAPSATTVSITDIWKQNISDVINVKCIPKMRKMSGGGGNSGGSGVCVRGTADEPHVNHDNHDSNHNSNSNCNCNDTNHRHNSNKHSEGASPPPPPPLLPSRLQPFDHSALLRLKELFNDYFGEDEERCEEFDQLQLDDIVLSPSSKQEYDEALMQLGVRSYPQYLYFVEKKVRFPSTPESIAELSTEACAWKSLSIAKRIELFQDLLGILQNTAAQNRRLSRDQYLSGISLISYKAHVASSDTGYSHTDKLIFCAMLSDKEVEEAETTIRIMYEYAKTRISDIEFDIVNRDTGARLFTLEMPRDDDGDSEEEEDGEFTTSINTPGSPKTPQQNSNKFFGSSHSPDKSFITPTTTVHHQQQQQHHRNHQRSDHEHASSPCIVM